VIQAVRKELLRMGKLLYQQQYIVATEGNLSCRIDSKNILITRSGVCKGELTPDDLIKVSLNKRTSTGDQRPSTEMRMHLEVYRQRPDVKAVIHAHPPYAVSLTLAGISLNKPYTPESVLLLGAVPTAVYGRPSTSQVAESIQKYLKKTDIILLERHGSLTVGKTLTEAFYKLEILENTAKIVWLTRQAGIIKPLPAKEVRELFALRKEVYGLEYPIIPFDSK
jgi:L-fuculose-phosphate aldolase